MGRVLLGDDTIVALNGAVSAVAIAPNGHRANVHRLATIGIGHDGSVESGLALRAARAVATRHGSRIRVRAVVTYQDVSPEPPTPLDWTAETERVMEAARARLGAIEDIESDVVYGDPGEELAAIARQVDLMVVGSRGQGPLGRLMSGSTSTYLARRVGCPLLVCPRYLTDAAHYAPDEPSRRSRGHAAPAS